MRVASSFSAWDPIEMASRTVQKRLGKSSFLDVQKALTSTVKVIIIVDDSADDPQACILQILLF